MVINMFGRVCIDLKKQRTPKLNYCGNRSNSLSRHYDHGKERGATSCAQYRSSR